MKTTIITILHLFLAVLFASGLFAGEICTCNPGPVCFDNMGKVIGCSAACVTLCKGGSVPCGSTSSSPSTQPVDTKFLKNKFDPNPYLNSLRNDKSPSFPLGMDDNKKVSEIMDSFIEKERKADPDEAQREEDRKILERAVDNAGLDESRGAQKLLHYTSNWKKYSISSNIYTSDTGLHQMLATLGNSDEYVEEQKKRGVSEEEAIKTYNKIFGGLIEKYKGEKIEEQTESDKAKYESMFRHSQPTKEEETEEIKEQKIFDPEPYIKSLEKDRSKSSPGTTEALDVVKLPAQTYILEAMTAKENKTREARKKEEDRVSSEKQRVIILMKIVEDYLASTRINSKLLDKYINEQAMLPDEATGQLARDIQSDANKNVEKGMDGVSALAQAVTSRDLLILDINETFDFGRFDNEYSY